MRPPAVLAIHGGAGPSAAVDGDGTGERWATQAAALAAALQAGLDVLGRGGPALEAVVAAVALLEDDPLWNAGRGSALTAAGTVEMDAALADGRTGRVGAVAAVTGVRHPIEAARAVLADRRHVLLAGPGAEAFARRSGLEFKPPDWFVTPRRLGDLHRLAGQDAEPGGGTVGAIARDRKGHLAAATSTGGRTAQVPGRIGDTPVPGAGTWANDATGAVSATGIGEAFLQVAFAHEIDARIRLTGATLEEACRAALEAVGIAGGEGGCLAVGPDGPPLMPFSTALMHRAWAEVGGPLLGGAAPGPLAQIG
ncbi:MAG TPA: isoaspartyl peptidase/L-asparaginase [Acidimicrobiia bacterium]|nr:isoaspartyl peptidase/L-asparaginase [Acidimicrobiia bacterium]